MLSFTMLCKDSHVICTGAFLAPVSVDVITSKHYAKNSVTKLNG